MFSQCWVGLNCKYTIKYGGNDMYLSGLTIDRVFSPSITVNFNVHFLLIVRLFCDKLYFEVAYVKILQGQREKHVRVRTVWHLYNKIGNRKLPSYIRTMTFLNNYWKYTFIYITFISIHWRLQKLAHSSDTVFQAAGWSSNLQGDDWL